VSRPGSDGFSTFAPFAKTMSPKVASL
jgi:hypothetical protein